MTLALTLLTLALQLLTLAVNTPGLSDAARKQYSDIANSAVQEALADLANPTQATSTPIGSNTGGDIDESVTPGIITPMNVYQLSHDDDGFYYAGADELESATVNGTDATIVLSKHLTDGWMVDGTKVYGYYMARFTAPAQGDVEVVLTSTLGLKYSQQVTVQ